MRPKREDKRAQSSPPRNRGRTTTTSPSRASRISPPSASLSDQTTTELLTEFEELRVTDNSEYNPRSFPYSVKQQCWEKAEKIKGRDPSRWRRDPLGNIVFRKLVGCPGCLCHDYDHILPYSKATVNRSKGNRSDISRADLIQKSSYCRVSGRDMDLLELSAFGNVRRGEDSGGCRIQ
uniref:HNH endonuclease n=1 Tax=Chenopodium quinoa TaxID=63459 RepID=A0A803L987_CHEQI